MVGDTEAMFEAQALEFIQLELPSSEEMGVNVEIMSVDVVEQTIIPKATRPANSTRRFLQEEGLRVRMNVTGEVTPGGLPDDFDFAQLVSMGFAKNYLVFAYRLASADPFFNVLLGDDAARASGFGGGNGSSDSDRNAGATAGIVIACLVALAIAGVAAFYAYRARDRPHHSRFQNPSVVTSSSGEFVGIEQVESRDMSIKSPTSPNTLENGKGLGITRMNSMASSMASSPGSIQSERILGIRAQAISPNNVETMLVAPSSKGTTIELDGGDGPPKNDEESLDGKLKKEVMASVGGIRSKMNDKQASQNEFPMMDDQDDQSTAAANKESNGVCCVAFDDFGDIGGLLGAKGMNQADQEQYKERNSQVQSSLYRQNFSGLYDVYAPPGPLGIVVDTTKDGPIVHSLKYTSALLGQVGSGDLIVGLDDMDTRSMTAATLTRLMAKRSNQSQRKITLLAMDN